MKMFCFALLAMTFTLTSGYAFPVNLVFQVNMTAAVVREIPALSSLLKGLCLQSANLKAAHMTQWVIPRARSFHKCTIVSSRHTFVTTVSSNSCVRQVFACQLLQRAYTTASPGKRKGPTPQKKFVNFDYSGDLVTQKPLPLEDMHIDYKDLGHLKDAPEVIQKLASIDFASGNEKMAHRREEMKRRIEHLFGKEADREMHVAMLTVEIRNMIPHVLTIKRDKRCKMLLVEKIQLRKKMLKYLRRSDYQRFMWLLQELGIRYVLPPAYYKRITRRYTRKMEVWNEANNLRLKKIADLKAQLEAEKEEFVKYKEETLKQIEADAQKYNIDLQQFEDKLKRGHVVKTYPRIYTWQELEKMREEARNQ